MGNAICTTPKDVTVRGSKETKETLDPANEAPTPVYLPLDVLSNVLSRLPVKTLCKLKCVSREWLKLISSDQHFLDSHSKVSPQNPVLLFTFHCFVNRRNKEYAIQLSSVDMKERFYSYFRKSGDSFYTYSSISCAGLSKNEYKVASLLSRPSHGDGEIWCQIFDLRDSEGSSGSWRNIGNCPLQVFEISSPACSNGVIYWLFQDKNHLENRQQMIALDLETEEFHMVRYPEHYSSKNVGLGCLSLVELKGCLCLVDNSSEYLITDVWMLKDPRNQIWVKEYSIGFSALEDYLVVCCYPVCDRDGELLLEASSRDEGNRGRLFFYDPVKKSFRTTKNLDRVNELLLTCLRLLYVSDTHFVV
ncbi:hypothetical protein RJ639_047037 [Escallonia herrerae]|uniref:F-box domain-containing protein n=1 Tax=Escallonia herrerae TaxID=1293975 RepID=A0AA88W7D7_9ASTE|nr:hypothetical protein RJ639_047037 [Escallonia herrerae]